VARPREFDTDQALRSALVVFWQKGFDGASLTDLADAMGIVRPSLHAAFGSKEDLYAKALDLYGREAMGFVVDALRGKTAADVCRLYLSGFCDMLTNPASPVGCFTLKAMMSCGRGAEIARQEGLTRTKSYETCPGMSTRAAWPKACPRSPTAWPSAPTSAPRARRWTAYPRRR